MEKVLDIISVVFVSFAFLGADFMLFSLARSESVNRKKNKALTRLYNARAVQIENVKLPYTDLSVSGTSDK